MTVSRIDVAQTKVGASKKIIEQPVGLNKGNPKDIIGIQRLLIRIGYPIRGFGNSPGKPHAGKFESRNKLVAASFMS